MKEKQKEIEKLKAKVFDLETKLSTMTETNETLEQQISAKKSIVQEQHVKIEQLQSEMLQQQYNNSNNNLQPLKKEDNLQLKFEKLVTESEKWKRELQQSQELVELRNTEISNLKAAMQAQQSENTNADSEEEPRSKIPKANNQSIVAPIEPIAQGNLADLRKQNKKLEKKNKSLQNNIMDCHKLIEEFENTLCLYTDQSQKNETHTQSLLESLQKLRGMHNVCINFKP